MRGILILWKREIGSFFLSPIAYLVMVFFLGVMGFSFWFMTQMIVQGGVEGTTVLKELFASFFFWLACLIVTPVITMRVFSEEKKNGTLELLMTTPVTEIQVVLGKYLGSLTFFILLWLPTLSYSFLLQYVSGESTLLDPGMLIAGYTGTFLLGAMFIALGVLCSTLTNNQIVSAMMSFALLCVIFLFGFLPYTTKLVWLKDLAAYFSSVQHMIDFSRGIIDSRPVVFYLSSVLVLLFMAVRILESRRWK